MLLPGTLEVTVAPGLIIFFLIRKQIMNEPIDLKQFLARFPLEAPWDKRRTLHYFWHFEVAAPGTRVWDSMIDTSRLNRRLGISEMQFDERNGRLLGRSRTAGLKLEWEEIPWQWEYARSLTSSRIYSRGFADYVRVNYLLEEIDPDTTRVYVYFGWVPRGLFGRILLWAGMPRTRNRYAPTVRKLVEEDLETEQSEALEIASSQPSSVAEPERLTRLQRDLVETGVNDRVVEQLVRLVREGSDEDLYRLRVRALARAWRLSLNDVLYGFLQATRAGHLTLTWDVICPHCRGVREEIKHLGDLPESGSCDVCDIKFETLGLNAYEVSFHVHASLRPVARRFFCSAEPATRDHIKIQLVLEPGEQRTLETLLGPGIYRLRRRGEQNMQLLEISETEHSGAAIVDWPETISSTPLVCGPKPTLRLRNQKNEPQTYVVESNALDQDILRPVDLFNFQDFRDLFSAEALSANIQLDVGRQTILFTDIVGSTEFYRQRGDQDAFAAVRGHFVEIYRVAREHNGAVVKTIGDAAMMAFTDPVAALRAAIAVQRAFPGSAGVHKGLRIRVSMNQGPCLAVNLNSGIDYFGSAVNLAAKLQSLAGAGQVAVPRELFENDGVAVSILWENSEALEETSYAGAGQISRALPVRCMTVSSSSVPLKQAAG